jgi:hypothetical protein
MKKREYHGLRDRPEYPIWGHMIQRCHNPGLMTRLYAARQLQRIINKHLKG